MLVDRRDRGADVAGGDDVAHGAVLGVGDLVEVPPREVFPGFEGLVFATGEFAFHHDTYVTAIEFWKELNDTGLIIPGAINFTVANARTRWAAGTAGFFPDGPWCAAG